MMNGKHGREAMMTVVMVAILLVAGIVGYSAFKGGLFGGSVTSQPQTIAGGSVPAPLGVVQTQNVGGSSSIRLTSVDQSSVTANTQYSLTAYCWKTNEPKNLITGIAGTSLAASGTTSINSVGVGDSVKCTAFNNTFYGDLNPKEIKLATEGGVAYVIPVNRVQGAKVTFFNKNDKSLNEFSTNFSLPANGAYSFSRVKVEQNNTNSAYALWGIAFDTPRSSNISDIQMNTVGQLSSVVANNGAVSVERSTGGLTRVTTLRFIFKFKQNGQEGVLLKQNDYVTTGALTFSGNGNGCGGYPATASGESITYYVIDANQYVSINPSTQGLVKVGAETDASTGTDVGFGDITGTLNCKGTDLSYE